MRILQRIGSVLLKPITANGLFFVIMYLLGVLCAVLTLPDSKGAGLYDNLWLELFLDTYLACVVLAVIPRRVRRWVRWALYAVLYSVAIADVFCFWKFGSTLTPTMLLLVGETDSREAGEFLSTYINLDAVLSPVGWILLLMLVHIIVAARRPLSRLLRMKKLPKVDQASAEQWLRSRKWLAPAGGLLTVVLLVWSVCASLQNKKLMTELMTADTIGRVEHLLTKRPCAEFYLPVYRLSFSVYSNHLAEQQIKRCIAAAGSVKVDSCSYRSPNIVLIIGESYSKAHCQLYGYKVKDTPRQLRLARTGMLTPYTDVVTCWNLTSFVFKNVLSMHVIGEKGEWCDYPLFPELFRRAGYKVTFLTNQFLPKAREAVYDFSGGFFLNNPTLSHAQFDLRNSKLHRYDEGLLEDYDRFVKDDSIQFGPGRHNLIIFHLIGQHVSYKTRYPADRHHFWAGEYKERRPDLANDNYRRRMIADYDNACLYNDSIVDQIVRRFKNRDAIVIYMPDHGEEIYEPDRDILCRNHASAVDWPIAHYEFEVPFWIWCSRSYAQHHPDVVRAVKGAKDKRFMTDALPHMMVWLGGIATKSYQPRLNLLSPQYDQMRPRILKNSADYDKLREAARREGKAGQ